MSMRTENLEISDLASMKKTSIKPREQRIPQSFACKPKDWGGANIGAFMTWRSM